MIKKLKVPNITKISQLTTLQIQELAISDANYADNVEYRDIKAASIITGVPVELIEAHTGTFFTDVVTIIRSQYTATVNLLKVIKFKDIYLGWNMDLHNQTWGEWGDLDDAFQNHDVNVMMSILYRPIKDVKDNIYIVKDYDNTLAWEDSMNDLPADVMIPAFNRFVEYRNDIIKNNPVVYSNDTSSEDSRYSNPSADFSRKWGYYELTDFLADGKIERHKEIESLPRDVVLVKLAYEIEKQSVQKHIENART